MQGVGDVARSHASSEMPRSELDIPFRATRACYSTSYIMPADTIGGLMFFGLRYSNKRNANFADARDYNSREKRSKGINPVALLIV